MQAPRYELADFAGGSAAQDDRRSTSVHCWGMDFNDHVQETIDEYPFLFPWPC